METKMTKMVLTVLMAGGVAGLIQAQSTQFQPGHLAVLRAGDGVVKQHLKQAPIFIDQFDPHGYSDAPSFSVAIPTNGSSAFFFNSHAATEGVLSRSADHRLLVFAGYGGVNLLAKPGVPSLLDIDRGFCTVDAAGKIQTLLYKPEASSEKFNPRGGATDGENNFWGCGNARATLFFNPVSQKTPMGFAAVENTRAMRIIDHALYATLNGPDATAIDDQPGIYQFVDSLGNPVPFPRQPDVKVKLLVPAAGDYAKISGFDLNTNKTIAYLADASAGIQKYVNSGAGWKLAYDFAIPQNIPEADNHETGCFGLVVDFSGPAPVIYATTTEGYGGTVNSNRVVRIVDTDAKAAVTTVAQCHSANVAFRGIDFTPEAAH
jgi:hypothetical protein